MLRASQSSSPTLCSCGQSGKRLLAPAAAADRPGIDEAYDSKFKIADE
jgi:hypothetical protein